MLDAAGAQRDEDDVKPGHEQTDAAQDGTEGGRRRRAVAARLQLGRREARDHGDVARDQREDAGGDEGEDPCPEGDEGAGRIGRDRGGYGG